MIDHNDFDLPSIEDLDKFIETGTIINTVIPKDKINKVNIENTQIDNNYFFNKNTQEQIIVDSNGFGIKGNKLVSYSGSKKIINIPDKVKVICDDVFDKNNSISEINIYSQVEIIHPNAFDNCLSLKKIIVHENRNYNSMLGVLFDYNLKKLVRIPIAYEDEITLPKSLEIIGDSAYSGCNIEKIDFTDYNIRTIEKYAFFDCKELKEVILGSSLEELSSLAFIDCDNIKKIHFLCDNYFELEDVEESKIEYNIPLDDFIIEDNKLIKYEGNQKTIRIPTKVKSIGSEAFENGIKKIIINKEVKIINDSAFDNCLTLQEIEVDQYNEYFYSYKGVLYNKDRTKLLRVPINNQNIVLLSSIETICDSSFSFCSIKSINFNKMTFYKLKTIENNAFYGCSALEKITFPMNNLTIKPYAFEDCSNLKLIKCSKRITLETSVNADVKYLEDEIDWNPFEIALLIESFIYLKSNNISYELKINKLSNNLKKIGINLGFDIDDKYRDTNEIIILLRNFNDIVKNFYNDLILQIYDIYLNKKACFYRLLSYAHNIIEDDFKEQEINNFLRNNLIDYKIEKYNIKN